MGKTYIKELICNNEKEEKKQARPGVVAESGTEPSHKLSREGCITFWWTCFITLW